MQSRALAIFAISIATAAAPASAQRIDYPRQPMPTQPLPTRSYPTLSYPQPGNPGAMPMQPGRPVGQMATTGQHWGGRIDGRWAGGYQAPGGWNAYHRPSRGWTLPSYWVAPSFYVGNYAAYGLSAPARGYRWSRYYDDAVLIDGNGRIYDMIGGVDWDRGDGGYEQVYDRGYDAGQGYQTTQVYGAGQGAGPAYDAGPGYDAGRGYRVADGYRSDRGDAVVHDRRASQAYRGTYQGSYENGQRFEGSYQGRAGYGASYAQPGPSRPSYSRPSYRQPDYGYQGSYQARYVEPPRADFGRPPLVQPTRGQYYAGDYAGGYSAGYAGDDDRQRGRLSGRRHHRRHGPVAARRHHDHDRIHRGNRVPRAAPCPPRPGPQMAARAARVRLSVG